MYLFNVIMHSCGNETDMVDLFPSWWRLFFLPILRLTMFLLIIVRILNKVNKQFDRRTPFSASLRVGEQRPSAKGWLSEN